MSFRRRTYSSGSDASDHFISINERPVDDISLEFFYRSHTITLLIVAVIGLIYVAFTRDDKSYGANVQAGLLAGVFFFLVISVLAFPNGPFTRPHPAVWRCVFGLSVIYMLALTFAIFQDYRTVRGIFEWFFPELKNFTIDMDKGEWGEKCDDLTFQRLWQTIDFFCFAHFAGWTMKTLLVRHYGILWTISVMWEITEISFSHLLPNFNECWWDAFILDVVLCNGLGIWFGMQICHWMEMRFYNWESIKDIQTTSGKLKRAVLQFTPESWTAMRWLDPTCTYMRFLAVSQLVIFWQISELNTFFIKHIFEMPPNHPFNFLRILLLGAMSAPSIRQYYSYVTDPRCKRVGTQCWVYGLCMCIESLLCIKFGSDVFQHAQVQNIVAWLLVQSLGSVICVYLCVMGHRFSRKRKTIKKEKSKAGEKNKDLIKKSNNAAKQTNSNIKTETNEVASPNQKEILDNFNLDLRWCLQQLEGINIKSIKNPKKEEVNKCYRILSNPKHPMIKKRQAMRTYFGDYKETMAQEAEKYKQNPPRLKKDSKAPTASVFLKKSVVSDSHSEVSDSSTDNISNKISFNSRSCENSNSFKFNFNIDDK